MIADRIGPTAITTSNVALGSAVPTGQTFTIRSLLIQQAAAGDAKEILVAIGTTATAANVVRRITFVAGVQNYLEFPEIVLRAGEQINVIGTGTTAQAVIEMNGYRDLAA